MLAYHVLVVSPSVRSKQPKQSSPKQQPAVSPVPSSTADDVDEIRPVTPCTTVRVCGMASAPAAAEAVCKEQSEEGARATEAAVLFLEGPVVSNSSVYGSGVKGWGASSAVWAEGETEEPAPTEAAAAAAGPEAAEEATTYTVSRVAHRTLLTREVRENGDGHKGDEKGTGAAAGGRSSRSKGGAGAAWGGASTHPLDRGKQSRWRRATRGVELGVDLPCDRGRDAWANAGGRCFVPGEPHNRRRRGWRRQQPEGRRRQPRRHRRGHRSGQQQRRQQRRRERRWEGARTGGVYPCLFSFQPPCPQWRHVCNET